MRRAVPMDLHDRARIVLAAVFIGFALSIPTSAERMPPPSPDATVRENLARLISRAADMELDRDPVWQLLLQFDPDAFGLWRRSSATTPGFFLSPRGRRDPKAELEATLASFFELDAVVKDVEHPQCAFIARRAFLIERLEISERDMPRVSCAHYDDWRAGLAATGITLIYPEGFMNNPASMFGHTLLRIDVATESRGEEILGYAVDFTGEPGEDQGLTFIAKGILGLYPGRFGVHPYYQQLRRYAEWENRDIWEYRLDLRDDELDFLLMHLWELRAIDHPYYFFTENCSYHLFRLLELAKPALRERNAMPTFVIPVDTVRETLAVDGFVDDIRYRPSPATRLELEMADAPRTVNRLAARIAEGAIAPDADAVSQLDLRDRARALEIAYERLRYAFVQGTRDATESRALSRRILTARSKITSADGSERREPREVPEPTTRPDQGHLSAAASVKGGFRDDEAIVDFQFRPAFHSLMDREGGYPTNMQIRFFNTNLRYFPERARVRLEELTLIEAVSLSSRSEIFEPFAWSLGAGLATRRVSKRGQLEDAAVARADIGAGLAFEPASWLHLYGLATGTVDSGPELEHDVSLGPGARAGVFLRGPADHFKSHFFADVRGFVVGDRTLRLRAGTEQRLTLSRNSALVLDGSYNRVEGHAYGQGGLAVQLHF